MKKWFWLGLSSVLMVIGLSGCGQQRTTSSKWVNSTTPTIFIHGYGSSSRAESSMVKAAEKAGITKTVVNANVTTNGHVTIVGPTIKGKRNPIVKVNLANNRQTNMAVGARYIRNVITTLQKRDGIKSYNLVAHSMGNTDAFSFINDYGTQKGMPTLKKQVVLAGAGVTDATQGEAFRQIGSHMTNLKNVYPHAQVLNIAGNLDDGSDSDGRIPNEASKDVKTMLGNRPASYRFVILHGKNAQHSKLHENQKVFKLINNFLWKK
ncbi:alpha/beta hydrolase [Limosilactobacillus caecicola]|uniref:alpha/beta hydrolase n=1 Tax=Limosilactobacillus caecicola TaxID=2941332 RepID=UPI00203B8F2B|nr:alpha/beta hydrolase [Limosilactobacillus caecicola]